MSAPDDNLYYSTRVRIEVEIDLGQAWGAKWTAEEAFKTSIREADSYLGDLVFREKGKIKIVGKPDVLHLVGRRKGK